MLHTLQGLTPRYNGGRRMVLNEYTPSQVAQRFRVSTRTVIRWFDSGRLPGYRHPKTKHRRIPHKDLIEFLKRYNLPVAGLEDEAEASARGRA